jgi:hypothetical protein
MGDPMVIKVPDEPGKQGRVMYGDDAAHLAEFCARESGYTCIFSRMYTFAIPRDLRAAGNRWTVKGVTFERLKTGLSVTIFGRRFDNLWLVVTPVGKQTEHPIETLYSAEYGVVGFASDIEGWANASWSIGEKGFGAAARE